MMSRLIQVFSRSAHAWITAGNALSRVISKGFLRTSRRNIGRTSRRQVQTVAVGTPEHHVGLLGVLEDGIGERGPEVGGIVIGSRDGLRVHRGSGEQRTRQRQGERRPHANARLQ